MAKSMDELEVRKHAFESHLLMKQPQELYPTFTNVSIFSIYNLFPFLSDAFSVE